MDSDKKAEKTNYWICKCKCGTEKEVFRGSLINGDSKSCGCVKSWGETQIIYLLKQYNIDFKKEVTFNDLLGLNGGNLRFDFGIYLKDKLYCLIEYDGRQHYYYNNNWKQKEENFNQLKIHDKLKDEYCKKHNIKLYRLNKDIDLESFIKELQRGMLNHG